MHVHATTCNRSRRSDSSESKRCDHKHWVPSVRSHGGRERNGDIFHKMKNGITETERVKQHDFAVNTPLRMHWGVQLFKVGDGYQVSLLENFLHFHQVDLKPVWFLNGFRNLRMMSLHTILKLFFDLKDSHVATRKQAEGDLIQVWHTKTCTYQVHWWVRWTYMDSTHKICVRRQEKWFKPQVGHCLFSMPAAYLPSMHYGLQKRLWQALHPTCQIGFPFQICVLCSKSFIGRWGQKHGGFAYPSHYVHTTDAWLKQNMGHFVSLFSPGRSEATL